MKTTSLLCLALASAAIAAPAVPSSAVAQDSPAARATIAREAMRRAGASQRDGLADSLWADVNRAHAAWPAQPAYAEALARFAARRGDDAALERVLRRLAAQGVGRNASADTTIARVAERSEAGRVALSALRAAVAPAERSRARVLMADTTFFAEGVDIDPATGTLYVTSMRHRTVMAVAPDGSARSAIIAASGEVAAAFGVAFDGTRGALWVTTAGTPHMKDFQPGDTARAELLRVRLRDGRIEQRWLLGDGKGMPGELSLTPSGDVLVSDGLRARLYRLRQGAGTMEVITSPVVRSPQGIAPSADGSVAWVADWSHGLLRWDLRTDSVTAVTTPDDIALLGVDGLRRHGDRLIGVQNGVTPARVVAITLDAGGRAVRAVETIDRPAAMEGEPTVGAIAGDRYVYVSSGGWPFFGDDGSRLPRTPALPPVTVRELTLRR